jgi:hypothetical protein
MAHPQDDALPPGALRVGYDPGRTDEQQKERLVKRWRCDIEKRNFGGVDYWVPCEP